MPLSKPVSRKHLHTREIVCRSYQRDDGLWDIEGSITDTKTYAFDNRDRGRIGAGEPVHEMLIRLTVDDDRVVHAAEASTHAGPFNICGDIASAYASLKGLRIGPGWRKAVQKCVGGIRGCTHITDLLMGPLAVTAYQAVRTDRKKSEENKRESGKPALLNTCHALASDSPIAKRQWPDHYTGT